MNEKLEKLKEIGAQKIYEDTHIPIEHVHALLHESFDGFSKVQFLGFISILEREYSEDLSDLRALGLEYFGVKSLSKKPQSLFITPKSKKNYASFYILLVVVVFFFALYLTINSSSETEEIHVKKIDNSIIEDAQKNIILQEMNETNQSDEMNASSLSYEELNGTAVDESLAQEDAMDAATSSLSIVAKSKVWIGYIDLQSNEHYQKTFTGELQLDPTKDWLLVFGHGYIDIVHNGEIQKFTSVNRVRFLYKDGEVKSITQKEFKRLNKGSLW